MDMGEQCYDFPLHPARYMRQFSLSDAPLPDTTVENKKDRKRKRHLEGDVHNSTTEATSPPKKQKKGKRDKETESGSHAQSSTSATSSESTPALPPSVQISITSTDSAAAAAFLAKHSITIHTPPSLSSVAPVISFDQLQIPEALKVAFKDFAEPTPIQACAWPLALQGHDVVGIAETGRYVALTLYTLFIVYPIVLVKKID